MKKNSAYLKNIEKGIIVWINAWWSVLCTVSAESKFHALQNARKLIDLIFKEAIVDSFVVFDSALLGGLGVLENYLLGLFFLLAELIKYC